MSNYPKVSVVTVTYNCEKTIEKTIKSIISQTYTNKEYLIIDGGSTDNTLKIINNYINFIDVIISEPDKGIFDAMNKALMLASGEYIIYINSGDMFYKDTIISDVFCVEDEINEDLIFGDVFYENKMGLKLEKANAIYGKKYSNKDLVYKSQGFSHQSLFTKTEILKKIKFDLRFPIGADYYATYLVYTKGNHLLKYVGFPIAVFNALDIGASHNEQFMKEVYDERCEMFGVKRNINYKLKMVLWKNITNFKYFLIKKMPIATSMLRKKKYYEDKK